MKYVGAHSTVITPENDAMYLGSGIDLPERTYKTCHKEILATYPTRDSLMEAEIKYIKTCSCVKSPLYYNKRLKTFDRHGTKGSPTNVGKTKDNCQYIADASVKRKQYFGNNRTPAQLASDARMRGKSTGPNPLKASGKGIKNKAFAPWYFIDSKGMYTEVHNICKKDYAELLGITPRQMEHRFHHTNQHKQAKGLPLKGYTFGNLSSKPTDVV